MFHTRSPTVWTAEPLNNDTIWVRTANGKTISALGVVGFGGSGGTSDYDGNFVFDTNLVWTGDSGTGSVEIIFGNFSNNTASFSLNGSTSGNYRNRSYVAIMDGGFKIIATSASTGMSVSVTAGASVVRCSRVHFIESAEVVATNSGLGIGGFPSSFTVGVIFDNCLFDYRPPITSLKRRLLNFDSANSQGYSELNGCRINYNITGAGDPGPIFSIPTTVNSGASLKLINCNFSGYANKYKLFSSTLVSAALIELVVDGCTGVKMDTALVGIPSFATAPRYDDRATLQFSSQDAGRSFRVETARGCTDWVSDAVPAFPTLNAIQPDGTPWSLRTFVFSTKSHTTAQPYRGPKLTQLNRLPTATRTITVEMLWPDTYAADRLSVALEVGYVDVDGIARRESTYGVAAPQASTAPWTGDSGYTAHTKKKLSLTTAYAVKIDTDISVWLPVFVPSATLLSLFYSPEFYVT
jgi:hypothetical protein